MGLTSAADLQRIMSDAENAKLKEALEQYRAADEAQGALFAAFMEGDIERTPEAMARFNRMVQRAAARGERELLVMQFPSSWCADRGRAINNAEPDWPSSLQGKAARAYDGYVQVLKPLGFRLRASILGFPGGMPGDVGFHLSW